jgi:hypothetical protein
VLETQITSDANSFANILAKYRSQWADPSAFRERRLTTFFKEMNRHLFGQLRDHLMDLGLNDLIVTAPGPLYGVPFDVLEKPNDAGYLTASNLRIRFAPSLAVAANIARHPRSGSEKLLAVGYLGDDLPNVSEEIDAIRRAWGKNVTARAQ